MASMPNVPSVVTSNAGRLSEGDFRQLLDFFRKPNSAEAMVRYCEKRLGIDPDALRKSIAEEEKALQKAQKELEAKKKQLEEQAKAQETASPAPTV